LTEAWKEEDPRNFLARVQRLIQEEPGAEKIYAVSELAYLAAKKSESHNPRLALDLYGASVLHAFEYLFDEQFRDLRNPYDPQFRGACDLYNSALEGMLRLVCRRHGLRPGATYRLETATGSWQLSCLIGAGLWRPEEFERFEFVSDYEIRGLKNLYRTYGLGVPLIAVRRNDARHGPEATYYPDNLSFPVTVFLRPQFGPNPDADCDPADRFATLELYDPLVTTDIYCGTVVVPLQSDLTTPLAYFLSDPRMANLATLGLLRPETLLTFQPGRSKPIMGLYMAQPYEPGKIPVVMIHGLWSSPMTWMEMFNDLRSSPEIRRHYQFWFYLYPTAQPFWVTAAQLRHDLAQVRETLDPYHREPALDQMVLIGHSMGGLVARLQTIDSGDEFWRLISDRPFEEARGNSEVLARVQTVLFFRPSPQVRRVITIGTPHRGSHFSNLTTQWIMDRLIRLPEILIRTRDAFVQQNRALIRDSRLLEIETSIGALDPESPFFAAMHRCPKATWVKYHNIIGIIPRRGLLGKWAADSDGVVSYVSAHMDDVESELIVPADHMTVHAHPRAVREVRCILLEHLAEIQSFNVLPPLVSEGPQPVGTPNPCGLPWATKDYRLLWSEPPFPQAIPWPHGATSPPNLPVPATVSPWSGADYLSQPSILSQPFIRGDDDWRINDWNDHLNPSQGAHGQFVPTRPFPLMNEQRPSNPILPTSFAIQSGTPGQYEGIRSAPLAGATYPKGSTQAHYARRSIPSTVNQPPLHLPEGESIPWAIGKEPLRR